MTKVTSNSSRKVVYGTGLGLVDKVRVKNQKYFPIKDIRFLVWS